MTSQLRQKSEEQNCFACPEGSVHSRGPNTGYLETLGICLHLCNVATLNRPSFGYSRPNTFGPQISHFGVFLQLFPGYAGGFSVLTWNTENKTIYEAACAVVVLNGPSFLILRPKASHFLCNISSGCRCG